MQRILSQREKNILFAAAALTILSLLLNFFIIPSARTNFILNKEIGIARIKLKKYLRLTSQKEKTQNAYKKLTDDLGFSSTEADPLISALSELQRIAQNADIKIIDIRPQSTAKSSGLYKEATIDIRAEGQIKDYLKFIYSLENTFSLLRIKRFQLSAKPNNNQLLEGSFSISQISAAD